MTKMACVRSALAVSRCFFVIALLQLAVTSASGQTTSATDGTTPQGLAPGSPAGSYALSGFDSINPYNGNLNFHLPLLQISGRGDAQIAMMLALNTKRWRVKHTSRIIGGEPVESFAPEQNWWTPADAGYGPGLLYGRQTGAGSWSCFSYPKLYTHTLTRLTFITPDGTEYELRDQATGGQPIAVTSCTSNGASRGTVFVSADGTAVTFVSDSAISDSNVPQGLSLLNPPPSGFLMMRNGLRYRIDAGLVTWIRDRNGNKLSFGYDGNGRVTSITDSLNRVVMIAYQSDEGPTYGICDRITFNGFNVAPRIIRIARYGLLENSFRPNAGYSKRSLAYLFPGLNGSQQTDYNPNVVSAVYLPDGRSYRFYYNEYGELERVLLPTGGAIEYRMSSGSGVYPTDPDAGDYQIYRRVTERQVYPDGTTIEGKTVYTASSSLPGDAHPWSTTVTIDQVNPSGTVLARSEHHFNGSGFASLFNTVGYYLYPAWDEGKEWRTFAFDSTGATALRRVTNTFLQRASVSWWSAYASQNNLDTAFEPALDTHLTEAVTKLLDVTPNLVSDQKYYYDQYNNQTAEEEFDYGSSSPPTFPTRRTETDYVTTGESNGIDYTATNVHLRSLPREQRVYSVNPATGALTQAASTHFYYDESSLTPRTGMVGWEAPATAARGNLTSITKWLDTGSSITTSQQYDIAGHVVQTTDALGNTSLIEFANSANTFAFATTMRTPVPDPTGSRGSNARLVTLYDYDISSGLLKSITDPNGQITTATYNDGLDRLTAVVSPTGGGQVSYSYGDTVGSLYVRTQRSQDASTTPESYHYFDGLGRSVRTSQSEASGSIFVDKQYDALGRVLQVSNPYRTSDTLRWTVTQYDGLGRVQTVTEPGGAQVSSAYSGNCVTVTDPASIRRTSVSDALGRVTSVIEDPGSAPHLNYQTSYTYDVLNDLRKVVQGGQTRYFGYDSLKRPIRVKNPEQDINTDLPAFTDPVTSNTQWSMAFSYDSNSNLATKTDPRNINFMYTYDAMNRVLTRSYPSDPAQTPPVDYKYDGVGTTAQNALGKLTAVNTSGSFVSS
jgi:YD repeat-containing protein